MDIQSFREHCLTVKGASESFPFLDPSVLVFKVMGKMFGMVSLEPVDGIFRADLKCDPERSVELRKRYDGIGPGHVKSTLLWNWITLESDVPDQLIIDLIRHSADEVIKRLPLSKRKEYEKL